MNAFHIGYRVAYGERRGTVTAYLADGYTVRWDDGRESDMPEALLSPAEPEANQPPVSPKLLGTRR